MDWLLYAVGGVSFLLTLIVSLLAGKGIKYLLISAVSGVALLLLAVLCGGFIGLEVSLNPVTLLISAAGGLPGTVFVIALRLFL